MRSSAGWTHQTFEQLIKFLDFLLIGGSCFRVLDRFHVKILIVSDEQLQIENIIDSDFLLIYKQCKLRRETIELIIHKLVSQPNENHEYSNTNKSHKSIIKLQKYRIKKHRRKSMSTTIQQRFNKQYTVLLHQFKIFQTLQKQQHFDICSNTRNYLETIDQVRNICESVCGNYPELITSIHSAEIHKIQHEIIEELIVGVNGLQKKMKSERNNSGVVGTGGGYCEFCGENMQENKIKRMKMALQEDYKQQFYLVLEQLKRLSEEKIFSDEENKQFEEVLVAQLNQRQKVLQLNDKRMEQFINILNGSLLELKKMKDTIFPDEEEAAQTKQADFKKMNHLNQHISTFLQTSFEKKIPPWIHKMFERLMQMYLESVNAKKRENGVQAYLDDPELRMARAQNRELHRNNKQLTKQIAQLKQDYKNLENYRTKQAGSYTGNIREHYQVILSNLNSNQRISQKNSSRRSTVKKNNRSHSKNSVRRNGSQISNSPNIRDPSKELKDQQLASLVLGDVLANKKAKPNKNIKPIQKRKNQSIVSSQGSNSNKNISGFYFPDIRKKRQSSNQQDDSVAEHDNYIQRKTERKSSRKMNDGKQIDQIRELHNRTIDQKQLSKRSTGKQNSKGLQKNKSTQKKKSLIGKSKKSLLHKRSDSKGQQTLMSHNNADYNSENSVYFSIKSNPNSLINKIKNHPNQMKKSSGNLPVLHNMVNGNEYGDATILKIRSSEHYDSQDGSLHTLKENRDADTEKMRKVSEDLAENAKKKLEKLYFNYQVGNIRKSNESGHSSQSNYLEGSIRRYQNSCFQSDDGLLRSPQQIPEQIHEQNPKTEHSTPLKIRQHQNSIHSPYHIRQHADSNFSNENSSIMRNSSLGSLSPQKLQREEEQRQTLQNFSQRIFRTMKKHNLLPQILNIQQFQAILREEETQNQEKKWPNTFNKKQLLNKNMGTIKQNVNPIEQDSLYPKNPQQSSFKASTVSNEYYSRMLPSIHSPDKHRYGQHFYILFYSKKQAFKYEQNLSKNYHRRRNHQLTPQQKSFSIQIYDKLSKKRSLEREQYNKICSVIRYPFDCLYNDFQTINFLTEMTYQTFEYYFQKIASIHKKCERSSKEGVCEHIQDFLRKI